LAWGSARWTGGARPEPDAVARRVPAVTRLRLTAARARQDSPDALSLGATRRAGPRPRHWRQGADGHILNTTIAPASSCCRPSWRATWAWRRRSPTSLQRRDDARRGLVCHGGEPRLADRGIYAYVEVAFGPFVGFLTGVLIYLACALAAASVASALASSVSLVIPGAGTAIGEPCWWACATGSSWR